MTKHEMTSKAQPPHGDNRPQPVRTLRDWLDQGAVIHVCGSLQGMAEGVDRVLRDLLGDDAVQQLADEGRYRRDVY